MKRTDFAQPSPRQRQRQRQQKKQTHLLVDHLVAVPEHRPPLGVAAEHVRAAHGLEHLRGDGPGERPSALGVQVLRPDHDLVAVHAVNLDFGWFMPTRTEVYLLVHTKRRQSAVDVQADNSCLFRNMCALFWLRRHLLFTQAKPNTHIFLSNPTLPPTPLALWQKSLALPQHTVHSGSM